MSNNKNEDSKGSTLNITKYNNSRSDEESNHAEQLHIQHTNVDTPSFEVYNWNNSCIKSSDTYSKDKKRNNNTNDIKENNNRIQMIENNKYNHKQQGNKYLQGTGMKTSDYKLGYKIEREYSNTLCHTKMIRSRRVLNIIIIMKLIKSVQRGNK